MRWFRRRQRAPEMTREEQKALYARHIAAHEEMIRQERLIAITDEMVDRVQSAYYKAAGITRRNEMVLSRECLRAALEDVFSR